MSSTVQKMAAPNAASVPDSSAQSESLQRKADMANNAAQRAEAPRPNNTGMPDNLKAGIESLSGFSMDDVRVHYNSPKPATVQALAYTQGTDIHVAPGQEKHLPHEAWHVAQQMAGRVSPTTNINGMPVNDNAALEHEADVMGGKAVQMKSDESMTMQRATIWNGVVQRVELNKYYYHITDNEIVGDIDPRHVITSNSRDRGDDLGPGFYMGDSDFLPYYYGKNFLEKNVYIYYIEKNLIDETMEENIKDFTEKTAPKTTQETDPDNWFQIAMQLGFRYVEENNVFNLQRPLDLLDPEKPDELDSEKMKKFEECVNKIYGDEASDIVDFFKDANSKAIWKGYINDIDHGKMEEEKLTITKKDIEDYFNKCGIAEICAKSLHNILETDSSEASYDVKLNESTESIKNELYEYVNKIYVENEGLCDTTVFELPKFFEKQTIITKKQTTKTIQKEVIIEKFKEEIKSQSFAEGLANALPQQRYDNKILISAEKKDIENGINEFVVKNITEFLNRKNHYTYNSLEVEKKESEEEGKVKPIQIAIRDNVKYDEKGKTVSLLEKIKGNMIEITLDDINKLNTAESKDSKPADSSELETKIMQVLAKEKKEKENGNL